MSSTPPSSQPFPPLSEDGRQRLDNILADLDRQRRDRRGELDAYVPYPKRFLIPFHDSSMLYWWTENMCQEGKFNKPIVAVDEDHFERLCLEVVDWLNRFLCRSVYQMGKTIYYIFRPVMRIELKDIENEWTAITPSMFGDLLGKFKIHYHKTLTIEDKDGNPKRRKKLELVDVVKMWKDHPNARFIDNFRFDPESASGLCELVPHIGPPMHVYNYWVGLDKSITHLPPDHDPNTASMLRRNFWKLDMILFHLRYILCRGDETIFNWILKWMAHCVNYPHQKMNVVLIFTGPQGSGKSFYWERFSKIFGIHGLVMPDSNLLIHKYGGSELSNKTFIVANEIDYRNIGPGVLKNIITNQSAQVEKKYEALNIQRVFYNMVWTSNDPIPIPLETGPNRRFFLVNVAEDKVGNKEYFLGAVSAMDFEGLFLLYHFLMSQEVSSNDPELSEAPLTEEKCLGIALKFGDLEQFWCMCLWAGKHVRDDINPQSCDKESPFWRNSVDKTGPYSLYNCFLNWLHKNRHEFWNESKFYRELHELLPNPHRAVRAPDAVFFPMPSLKECRDYFFKKTRVPVDYQPSVIERHKRKLDQTEMDEGWAWATQKRKEFVEKVDRNGFSVLTGHFSSSNQ